MQLTVRSDYTIFVLDARASIDRKDVDLSITTLLRALRENAQRKGHLAASE